MNLLHEPWIPVRRQDGRHDWIAPDRLCDSDIVAFDAARPDFNGALAQFAIGLLQTTTPVDDVFAWRQFFASPPDEAILQQWFAPVEQAFEFDGDGARFMQDFSLKPDDGATNDIAALLIEAPGEQTLKKNGDLFIKRGQVEALCPRCAALALLTLQINAPTGGAGHRTGLRGGGPLTTLLLCQPRRSLWHDLWLNVREKSSFLAHCGNAKLTTPHFTFPWLADITAIQADGGETAPMQIHPAHVFWAMPRRIRLDFDMPSTGNCHVCGYNSDRLLRQYSTKNYGLNYKGPWDHPLAPYYEGKDGWLPLHPQPGGLGYRHWLAWVFGLGGDKKKRAAAIVTYNLTPSRREVARGQLRLWAFGYDMDNMKARCWYESTLPLYGLEDCEPDAQRRVEAEVSAWLAGADYVVSLLRGTVKDAWFSAEARGDFSMVDASFWNRTEVDFYRHLKALIEAERADQNLDALTVRQQWHQTLKRAALAIFDEDFVGAGMVERQNPRRAAEAFRFLRNALEGPTLRQTLGLPGHDVGKEYRRNKKATKRAA